MCGLCGYVIRDTTVAHHARETLADALLLGVDHRGGDATGLLAIGKGSPLLLKAAIDAERFSKERPALHAGTRAVIGHTRLATQGSTAWAFNNHPVRVGDTYLAHNGHVHNQRTLREKVGFSPMQEVDSALLAALVDTAPDPVAALDLFHHVEGAAAVTYWNPVKAPGTIVLARVNGSPLHVWEGRKAVVWASTAGAVIGAWKAAFKGAAPRVEKVRALAEGEAVLIHADGRTEHRRFERGADSSRYGWTPSRQWFTPAAPPKALPAAPAKGKGRKRGKASKAGSGAPTGAPTPTLAQVSLALADDWRYAEDGALSCAVPDALELCDSCGDLYTRTQRVDIGGETFMMCASCASWAEGAIWGE